MAGDIFRQASACPSNLCGSIGPRHEVLQIRVHRASLAFGLHVGQQATVPYTAANPQMTAWRFRQICS